ncbi:hypothetical protein [Saccharicrinis sp. FJH54]|uniref:hypothetical protein n=1 Tax=Saccharicrinis sp. FJH54 TaxID=3344665 RepID=UPI0035D40C3C
MKQTFIIIFLMLFSLQVKSQVDTRNWDNANDIMNYHFNSIPTDSILNKLGIRYNVDFSSLLSNIMIYGFKRNLSSSEINAIENRTMILVEKYYEIRKPIKIIKVGGVGGGGEMKVEKSEVNGNTLYTITLSKTDLEFEYDKFQNELIDKINEETSKLIKGN